MPSAFAKTIKHYNETGSHEDAPGKGDQESPLLLRMKFIQVTNLRNRKLTAPQIRAPMNDTQSSSSRHNLFFKIEGTLNQHGYHSILQQHAIPSNLHLVGPSFIFQQDNDPKHTSRLCKGYLTKNKTDGGNPDPAPDDLASTVT